MPQIKVNEIDQSVVTRVVSDDKVKVLVPIIASFGPTLQDSDDGEPIPVNTFTDITDFNRMYGYTEVEFNPFKEEYSRNYAAQLIQKGAAVSVVKVNKGEEASFDLGAGDRTNPSESTVCPASKAVESDYYDDVELDDKTTFLTDLGYTNIVPGTVSITFTVSDGTEYTGTDVPVEATPVTTGTIALKYMVGAEEKTYTGTITYASGAVAWSGDTPTLKADTKVLYSFKVKNFVEGTFCPQIASIKAKYDGSFGNDLMLGITQITTSNVSQAYQYANISVYRAIKNIIKDANGKYVTVVSGISILETKRVTTDPESPYYFEDVDFDFIKITGTDNAREELKLVWSNISANPESNTVKYSGFPTVRVRYTTDNGSMVYNVNAMLTGGSDFAGYSQDLLEKLRKGFKGYYTSDNTWNLADVYAYQVETYGSNNAVVPSIYSAIANTYKNFTDPYVYDFDFITSGGFFYMEYSKNVVVETNETAVTTTVKSKSEGGQTILYVDTPAIASGTFAFTASETDYVDTISDDPSIGNIYEDGDTTTIVATINYSTGVITNKLETPVIAANQSVTYKTLKSVKPQLVTVPKYFNANKVKASYYDEINPIHAEMKNLVETRQDCIALFDVPYDYDTTLIVDYSALLNTSYGTIHHPWCWVQHPTIASKQIRMAPSYIFLYTFLSNLIDNVDSQKWFPPAGVKRATARVVKRPDYEIGSVILNMWQNDNISRVNPIMKLKQYGYVIYGQYTTLQAIDLYTHSALESLNVRLISNVVKKKIFDVCLNLAFEPNTSTLWLKFFAQMDEFLRYMKYNDGVYDYKIKMDESTVTTDDINHLRCPGKVWIAPTRTAEFFDIDFIITEAGALFPED